MIKKIAAAAAATTTTTTTTTTTSKDLQQGFCFLLIYDLLPTLL
jgi:hypothetical protein